jgi:hypothetical protein
VRAKFSGVERDVLRHLTEELVTLLEPEEDAAPTGEFEALLGIGTATTPPEDPVLARLLPDAYRDDPQAAGDFRRYTEGWLRSQKTQAANGVLRSLDSSGGSVELDDEGSQEWLSVLTDLRLAVAGRVGLETEDDYDVLDAMAESDPRRPAWDIYLWLGYLQETLVDALS